MDTKAAVNASRRQLVDLAAESAANAAELLADAEYLFAGSRWPRAYALSVLASEEFGKAAGALVLSIIPPGRRTKALAAELLVGHIGKSAGALLMRALAFAQPGIGARVMAAPDLPGILRNVEALATAENEAKNSGLYADLNEDGIISTPASVTEDDAWNALGRARDVAAEAVQFSDADYLAVLADPPEAMVSFLTPLMLAAMDAGGADPTAEETATMVTGFARRATELAGGLQVQQSANPAH